MKQKLDGAYIEKICLESSMSGLNESMKKLFIPVFSFFLLGGLNSFYMSENLHWGYSNSETKNKISLFYNAKNELDSLKNSKNKLLAKCYFPFYSELGIEDSQNLSGLDKKISLLEKNKSEIKENILKNDELLYSNYSGGKFLGGFLSLASIIGFLASLKFYYHQKKEIIKDAKENRAYWDSLTGIK